MVYLLSLVCVIFALAVCSQSVVTIRRGGGLILPITSFVFAARVTVGLGLIPLLDASGLLVGLDLETVSFNYHTDSLVFLKQALAHSFVLAAFSAALMSTIYRQPSCQFTSPPDSSGMVFVGFLFLTLAVASYFRFFFFGPGIQLLLETKIFHSSAESAVAHRMEVQRTLQLSQGSGMAEIGAYILFPLAAYFFASARKGWFRVGATILCGLMALAYTLQTRQKAPPVFTLLTFSGLLMLAAGSKLQSARKQMGKVFLLIFAVAILSIASYVLNFGLDAGMATISFVARTFVVPASVEAYYFMLFPTELAFRGLFQSFYILPPLLAESAGDYSVRDIAYYATGNYYSANASFVAVAWSGSGFVGVIVVLVTLTALLVILDVRLRKFPIQLQLAVAIISFTAVNTLTSGGLTDYIARGGIVVPALALGGLHVAARLKVSNLSRSARMGS